jgi:hypothetical protein
MRLFLQLFDLGSSRIQDLVIDITTYDSERANLPRLRNFLQSCTSLQRLSLSFSTHRSESNLSFTSSVVLDSIFASSSTWPELRELSLDGVEVSSIIMGDFFSRHPTLEVFDSWTDGLLDHLSPGTLPNLRTFYCYSCTDLRNLVRAGAPSLNALYAYIVAPEQDEMADTLASLPPSLQTIHVPDPDDHPSWEQTYVKEALPSSTRIVFES